MGPLQPGDLTPEERDFLFGEETGNTEYTQWSVEGFISGGFPVLRSLYEDDGWHELVRSFIGRHRCHSPYFLEISREFLEYLAQEHRLRACDPPFIAELAHYEWVELALDVSVEILPPESAPEGSAIAMSTTP